MAVNFNNLAIYLDSLNDFTLEAFGAAVDTFETTGIIPPGGRLEGLLRAIPDELVPATVVVHQLKFLTLQLRLERATERLARAQSIAAELQEAMQPLFDIGEGCPEYETVDAAVDRLVAVLNGEEVPAST